VLGVLAFILYLATAARYATFGDGPELAAAAYQLGVPHPTGYPLYMLLTHLFIRLIPVGEVIFRTTLFSAVTCAAAVGVLYVLGTLVLRQRWVAAFVAALFAVSETFWGQAVLTEVYGLHMLLTLAALTCLVFWDRTGTPTLVLWAAFFVGLSLTHHLMSVMWLPAMVLILVTSRHREQLRGQWRPMVLLVLAPLLLYLYLPIAAFRDPPMNWGDPRTLRNFLDHVTGAQYRFKMGYQSWASLWHNLYNYGGWPQDHVCDGYLLTQFSVAIIWLAPVGIWSQWRRNRRLLWIMAAAYAFPLAWALAYNIPDPDAYYLPSHVIVALWIGQGLRELVTRLAQRLRHTRLTRVELQRTLGILHVGLFVLPALVLTANYEVNNKSRLREIKGLGHEALKKLPRGACLVASGDDWGFAVLYAQNVDGVRPDVVILFEPYFQYRTWRLVQRERRRGLVIEEAACSRAAVKKDDHGLCRLWRVVLDNYRRVPIYIGGPLAKKLDESKITKRKLPKYEHIVERVPFIHFLPNSKPEQPSPELYR